MKVLLISPSNELFTPYIKHYTREFDKDKVDWELVCWDRLNIEKSEKNKHIYKDNLKGHQRGLKDYWRYKSFVENILENGRYDKIVVFGIQLTFFLKRFLLKSNLSYIIDIRDYHKLIKFMNFKKIVKQAYAISISSEAYKQWLPKSTKYIISHNILHDQLRPAITKSELEQNDLRIDYIGTLTNLKVNLNLINSLKNQSGIIMSYRGLGLINEEIQSFIHSFKITNVEVKGQYMESEEATLYSEANIINLLLDSKDLNSRTCMANRFYNALVYGRPLLITSGTYMSSLVEQYNLGLVIDDINEDLLIKLETYVKQFSKDKFDIGRQEIFQEIQNDKDKFHQELLKFISE